MSEITDTQKIVIHLDKYLSDLEAGKDMSVNMLWRENLTEQLKLSKTKPE